MIREALSFPFFFVFSAFCVTAFALRSFFSERFLSLSNVSTVFLEEVAVTESAVGLRFFVQRSGHRVSVSSTVWARLSTSRMGMGTNHHPRSCVSFRNMSRRASA